MTHRHDIRAIKALLQEWGVEGAEHMTIADILDTPICIPKTRMPNGITDIVAAYDQKVGGNAFLEVLKKDPVITRNMSGYAEPVNSIWRKPWTVSSPNLSKKATPQPT